MKLDVVLVLAVAIVNVDNYMIKIGNILIDPDSVDTIVRECRNRPDKEKGFEVIQIIYKSGVVKNFTNIEIGLSFNELLDQFTKITNRQEDTKLLKLVTMLNQNKHV